MHNSHLLYTSNPLLTDIFVWEFYIQNIWMHAFKQIFYVVYMKIKRIFVVVQVWKTLMLIYMCKLKYETATFRLVFFHFIHQRLYFWTIPYISKPLQLLISAMLIQQQIEADITQKSKHLSLKKTRSIQEGNSVVQTMFTYFRVKIVKLVFYC